MANGDLLAAAEAGGFEIFLTTDQNLRHQQNLAGCRMGIVVLPTTQWQEIQQHVAEIQTALNACKPGDYTEVAW